jgi:hypothetical protein
MATTTAKASVNLKRRFRKAKEIKGNEKLTLNQFAKKLAKEGDTVAQSWFAHKSPRFNDEAKAMRLKNKGAKIAAERAATKLARRKKAERSRNKGKTSTEAPATVTTKKV